MVISGLTINDTASYSGLFGLLDSASIENVVIKNAKINVGSYAGVLAGKMNHTDVRNCIFESIEIKGTDHVGALAGQAMNTQVSYISVEGSIRGTSLVGGLVGDMSFGTLFGVVNKASVVGTKDVGGVAGRISSTKLERSGNYGSVAMSGNMISSIGGVVGVTMNKSRVNEVFNAASVSADKAMAVGGIVGNMKGDTCINVFNHGNLVGEASNMGGLVGIADVESVIKSGYNKGEVPDENYAGVVAGKASMSTAFVDVYYDKTIAGTGLIVANHMLSQGQLPQGLATENMKTSTFVAVLNGDANVWSCDPANWDGYPVFDWLQ
jgi:hypothetical protein